MFINITDKKEAANKGSSATLVHYLEKENRLPEKKIPERWFNGVARGIQPHEVYRSIDGNVAKLGKSDAKFFLVNISPSQKEIAFLTERFGKEGARQQLKDFAVRVMDEYAKNFKRDGVAGQQDLLWFAKLEDHRYFSFNDAEVKKGERMRGEKKDGEQIHIQVIVSRKDITNRIKLSPQNTSKGKNEEHSKKMGQFDRLAFKQSGEALFDEMFGFDRGLRDSLAYANVQKNGTLSQREELAALSLEEAISRSSVDVRPNDQLDVSRKDSVLETLETGLADTLDSFSIDISDDIDDEAILGRNRHRKKKARTNTR